MISIYTGDDIERWLTAMSAGRLDLGADNVGLATAALALLAPEPAPTPEPLPPGQLTPHFALAEFTRSATASAQGIDNTPGPDALDQLQLLAELMEDVRAICGDNPVIISSGYRSPALNAAVGGATNSAHMAGAACDFTVPAFGDPLAVCRAIQPHVGELGVDQLIYESGWVHLGRPIPPSTTARGQLFSIIGGATTSSPFPG